MYIVCWMNKAGRSYWAAFDDVNTARAEYERLQRLQSTYTVTLAGAMESTDYSPAPELMHA